MKEKTHKGHAKAYIKVWIALLALTVVTVAVSYHDYGDWNIFVAMLVATVKASLVCLIFMHLLYDKLLDRVVFVSSFVFLAIFILLTASDELFRKEEVPVKVAETAAGGVPSQAEWDSLRAGSPELLAKGKELYAQQCAVCHGADGKGDGPAGGAMNPPPRNFADNTGWHFGQQPTAVFKTITDGSPGTGMAAFGGLGVADRWGLVQYVRSFAVNPPPDTPETVALVKLEAGSEAGAKPSQTIPIGFAIEQMAVKGAQAAANGTTPTTEPFDLGGRLYQARCAGCHGANGKGGVHVTRISVNPPVYLTTKSFAGSQAHWVKNRSAFVDLVSKGIPGSAMPGQADFTDAEWDALYDRVRSFINR